MTVLNWVADDSKDPKDLTGSVAVPGSIAPLALVFTDVVGSSAAKRALALGADTGTRDRAYLEGIQSKHLRLVRTALAEHHGQEIMTIGDSFFLTFAEITDAVRCASAIQQRLRAFPIDTPTGPMQLRIGIHIGTPEFFENSWHGTDVDTAARVESAAIAQQILVSNAAREAAGEMTGITFRPIGTYALKGVGDLKLWDVDYDGHGLRRSHLVSLEAQRRSRLFARSIAVATILLVVAVAGFFLYKHQKDLQRAAAEKNKVILSRDSIILADLANKTGDPIFDTTLTQAISIQLAQSPVLNLISAQHVRQSLQYMGRKGDEAVTPEIAREIGQREGIKAYLTGSVVKLGNSYLITLSAQSTNNGDNIASEQAQASDKDHVLEAVGQVVTKMRARLGESLASIQKLDTPFGQATTTSLQAFRAYALGDVEHTKGLDIPEAEGHYRQAVELDPTFAMAWARLGVVYSNAGQYGKGLAAYTRAFELSKNVSERERLYIQAHYYQNATGQLEKAVDTLELSAKTYPHDISALVNLGLAQTVLGHLEAALQSNLKATSLDPSDAIAQYNVFGGYIQLSLLDNAAKTLVDIQHLGIGDGTLMLTSIYELYFFQGNTAGMAQVLAKGEGRVDQYQLTNYVASVDEFIGRYADAQKNWNEASRQAAAQKASDAQASNLLYLVSGRAIAGFCKEAPQQVRAALALDKTKATLVQAALTASLCNDAADANPLLAKLGHDYPQDTIIQKVTIPQSRAAMALADHQPAVALQELEGSKSFDLVSVGAYLRGLAYLELHDGPNAIDSFQRATKYKGACISSLQDYGQGRLGLARAYVMAGDKANAKKTYEDLITLWKDADPDLPQLLAAKQEYAALP